MIRGSLVLLTAAYMAALSISNGLIASADEEFQFPGRAQAGAAANDKLLITGKRSFKGEDGRDLGFNQRLVTTRQALLELEQKNGRPGR